MPEINQRLSAEEIAALEERYLFRTYSRTPLYIASGSGAVVYDLNGKSYIDMLAGIAVNALGYNHPRIVRVLREQAGQCIHVSNLFYHPWQGLLARRLAELSGLSRVFFANSGAEAVEAALKLARAWAKLNLPEDRAVRKSRVVAIEGSFHGRTYGALSATSTEKYRRPFAPLLEGFSFARANDIRDLEEKVNEETCAVIIEPIQGESGVRPMSGEFLGAARRLCDRYNALLIFDEIQCGLGRTGRYFSFQKYHLLPDLVTIAKPLAGGLPLSALIGAEKVAAAFSPGLHGTTFGGGPLACRVALEFLSVLEEENMLERVARNGDYLLSGLRELARSSKLIKEVRGEGLIIGVELEREGKPIVAALLEAGFITNCVHETTIRLLPPYVIERRQIDAFLDAFKKVLK